MKKIVINTLFVTSLLLTLGNLCWANSSAAPRYKVDVPASSQTANSHTIELKDSHIEYVIRGGKGKTVILLPGGGLSIDYMDGLAKELTSDGYQTVSINPRGAGNSTGKSEDVTLHDLANDVAAVIKVINADSVNVVGHAFGNRVARMLDADHPKLVDSVILLAAGGKVPGTPAADKALKVIFSATATEKERESAMTYMVGDPKDAKIAGDTLRASHAPSAGPIQYAAAATAKLEEWWAPSGTSRYLIIQGSLDQAAPAKNGQFLKKDLGERAKLVSIDGAGHLMLITQPKVCSKEIALFLRNE